MKLIKIASIAVLSLSLWSCQNEGLEEKLSNISVDGAKSQIKSLMGITNFPVVKQADGTYLHDDILLEESNFDDLLTIGKNLIPKAPEKGALALHGRIRKWPNNTVVYRYDNTVTAQMKDVFRQSMDEWKSKTNIRFKERTNEADYVTVKSTGDACFCGYANLGQNRNRGVLAFGTRAPLSVVLHEIGHTLGYIHEQNRSDRDNYVKVLNENIQEGGKDQFFKSDNSNNLTDKLDITSIMMYDSFAFSKNRRPTITNLDGSTYRRSGTLSASDIAGTNKAYPGNDDDDDDNGNEDPAEPTEPTKPTTPTTPKNTCDNIASWNANTTYTVGDKVTFLGYIFERDFSAWNLLRKCELVTENKDICEGYENFNGGTYNVGDKVIYRGDLYERVRGGWIKEGQCGSN